MTDDDQKALVRLRKLHRWVEGLQIIIVATMGQYIYTGGSQNLTGRHWGYARDFFHGYQNVGLSLIIIAVIGFIGLFSLAVTERDTIYIVLGWAFSILAAVWFIGIGISHGYASATIPGAGSTGLWTLGLAGLFFLSSRMAISIVSHQIYVEEHPTPS